MSVEYKRSQAVFRCELLENIQNWDMTLLFTFDKRSGILSETDMVLITEWVSHRPSFQPTQTIGAEEIY